MSHSVTQILGESLLIDRISDREITDELWETMEKYVRNMMIINASIRGIQHSMELDVSKFKGDDYVIETTMVPWGLFFLGNLMKAPKS